MGSARFPAVLPGPALYSCTAWLRRDGHGLMASASSGLQTCVRPRRHNSRRADAFRRAPAVTFFALRSSPSTCSRIAALGKPFPLAKSGDAMLESQPERSISVAVEKQMERIKEAAVNNI